jgi:hypothetical protein
MPVEWRGYDSFDWDGSQQEPMGRSEREAVEVLAGDLLGLGPEARRQPWGVASPPGRFAATVIHVYPTIDHRFRQAAAGRGIREVGVKVFKRTSDARQEARRVLPFYSAWIHQLPGLPNEHVQRTLEAGMGKDAGGHERAWIIQEWVTGETLEGLLRRRWPGEPADGACVGAILEQLLGDIIIPLWSEGTLWWDVRDANYTWNERAGRLTLIDVDALAAYMEEIVLTPDVWSRRDRGRATALARLRQMTLRLLLAQGREVGKGIRAALIPAWQEELEPALRELGHEPLRGSEGVRSATASLHRFFSRLNQANFLRDAGTHPCEPISTGQRLGE